MSDPSWATWKAQALPWVDRIRSSAPNNIVLISGPEWAQGIGEAAIDPFVGANLAYVGHVYPVSVSTLFVSSSAITTAAAVHTIIVTEWGYQSFASDVFGGTQSSFGNRLKSYVEAHGLSWTAWCADNVWGPAMFGTDWSLLTGSDQMGGFVKDWLEEKKDLEQTTHG